ncbi:hypothetical protein [Miltoncostaea oceani]|uniref:hypothetical protein n=1 Tax=Miltoncostaea oceani TaxID=2843216 RepID=UPI001C3E4290|nr:hypothetical protein [Miltoncostaea oceani]
MNQPASSLIRPHGRHAPRAALLLGAATLLVLLVGMVGRADAACYFPSSGCSTYHSWTAGETAGWSAGYGSVFNIFTKQPPGSPGRSKSQRTNTGGSISPWYSDTSLYHQVNFPNSQTRQIQCRNSSSLSNTFLCGYNGV